VGATAGLPSSGTPFKKILENQYLEELRGEAIARKGELLSLASQHITETLKLYKKYAKIRSNRSKLSEKGKADVSWSDTGLIRVMLKLEPNEQFPKQNLLVTRYFLEKLQQ